ncbi:zeta toxin family protein [Streptomyces gamaensis]|uniref:UDP-N-acetylglucosamine kinase n=1 Tax=Streptomyces gamaensis TaxID=1763542 RepID=A0ABW0Z5Q0_9ACTN
MRESEIAPAVLPENEHREILTSAILPAWTKQAVRQVRPVAVIVAGQPGSGKTLPADVVHTVLNRRGGAVRVDHDLYKAVHRHYTGLVIEDVRTAGVRLRPDTRRWQTEVEAHVRACRYDMVLETPLADADAFRGASAAYRRAGYRLEVVALAVPEAVSQLGVLDRYLRLAEAGRARYVSWENHDTCAAGLMDTLAAIEAEQLADRVLVVRRGIEVLYDNELDSSGRWRRPAGAVRAVVAERSRPWSAAETGQFRRMLADADRRAHAERLPADWGLAVRRDAERAGAWAEPVRRTAQVRREPPGVDYHRLSAEEHAWIFDELIAPSLLGRITPQERPAAVYVMGQPGAGKTRTARLVRRALRGRPTWLTGDDFKVSHPDYLQLLREEPRTAGARIRADYRAWQARAEAYVRERRGDVVIEIAPDSAAQFVNSAALYRQSGYRIELVVLGVRAADSRQGTAARYAQVSRGGSRPGRFTTVRGHDASFAAVGQAVAAAEELPVADSVVVMLRDGSAVYRNERTSEGCWQRPVGAVCALVAEQHRPYTIEEAAAFLATQRWLLSALPQYREELIGIGRLTRPLLPFRLQPARLPRPRSCAGLPLPVPCWTAA